MYLQAVCRLVSTKVYPLATSSCVLVTTQVREKILILFYLLAKMSYRVLCSFFFFQARKSRQRNFKFGSFMSLHEPKALNCCNLLCKEQKKCSLLILTHSDGYRLTKRTNVLCASYEDINTFLVTQISNNSNTKGTSETKGRLNKKLVPQTVGAILSRYWAHRALTNLNSTFVCSTSLKSGSGFISLAVELKCKFWQKPLKKNDQIITAVQL